MWPINYNVISIYNAVSNQVIMSMNGVVAAKESAIMNRIKLRGIKKRYHEETLDLVSMGANKVISLRNEENRRKQENKK